MDSGQNKEAPITPRLAVDVIIDRGAGLIVLIKRKNEPQDHWALPGGFVDVGESIEEAALREAKEETGLDVELIRQFHVYSEPSRDPRGHTVSVVFIARAKEDPQADSDAAECGLYHEMNIPDLIAFDHKNILRDYFTERY
jgi:8-oxo-dGTP diphosphatase